MSQQSSFKAHLVARSQMNSNDMMAKTAGSRPRDDLRTAYSGDENHGPAAHKKTRSNDRTKARRLPEKTDKTPVR